MDRRLSDTKKIIMKLHADWGRASAHKLKRAPVGSDGRNMHLLTYADEVSEQCEVRLPLAKAPHVPIANTSTASRFAEKLRADLLFPDDLTALRALDVFPKYSLLMPVRSKDPREVWGALRNSRIGVCGQPQSIQIARGGVWRNELWADVSLERKIKLQHEWGRRAPLDC